MRDFADYIEHLELPEAEAATLRARIRSWTELQHWLDRYSLLQGPGMQRISVIPAVPGPSLKEGISRWLRSLLGRDPQAGAPPPARGWEALIRYRRRVARALTLSTTALLLWMSFELLSAEQMPPGALETYLLIYGVMTYFLALNAYKVFLGLWHTRRSSANPWHPSNRACNPAPGVKAAIVFPVLHEDAARVAAGVAATWQSIAQGFPRWSRHFDVFLLSDSSRPEHWIAEEAAIHELRKLFPEGRFFYRRRLTRSNAKLGNIMDFCRRWGGRYQYMLMMDADSVMDGQACVSLLRMMEGNPTVGILQTNPKPVFRHSLFGRMQQFAGRLYGSVFSYSLQAMYMGHACYIGHNAIIRMKPFIEHCILPTLSGKAPWGGKPLSHDIVESALMARAGYEVWFLPEIEGTYEEIPANIVDFLIRERRWMQGNLQHLRFLFLNGLSTVHREIFFNGSLGYVSAPLWSVFLLISGYGAVHFFRGSMIAPGALGTVELPVIMLGVSAVVFLFLPRLLALFAHIRSDRARLFGGKDKLAWSMVLETVFSFFFSSIMMINLTRFIWLWLKRRSISWDKSQRRDGLVPWDRCWRYLGWVSAVGLLCAAALGFEVQHIPTQRSLLIETISGGWVTPGALLVGFFPIIGGFSGSVLIVRFTSRVFPSVRARRLFCIPEEIEMPPVLRNLLRWEERLAQLLARLREPGEALVYAISDPEFYVKHRPQTRLRPHIAQALLPKIRSRAALSERELLLSLGERRCFDALHMVFSGNAGTMSGAA